MGAALGSLTFTGSARGYAGNNPDAPLSEQVAWLVERVEQLQTWADEDRMALTEKIGKARAAVDDLATRHDQHLTRLDDATRHIGAGTARLQLRGLVLVAIGTLLTALASAPG